MSISKRIRQLRGEKNLTEFGAELGVSGQQISKIETGNSTPSVDLAMKICEKYNVSMDWLFRGVELPKPTVSAEPEAGYVTIPINELLDLQRIAKNMLEEKVKSQQKQIEQLKNS
ncbi:helix-turn-helix domain-containing protein [Arundinibacter roseus]|uniref:XRE family transcriptional regulator n=1 Tax=Arundinibacter roseus TaxID=2070510 RepID=A0A4V2X9R5_9BACT|nr:helix-turn-helix transcriptional regulator [Arundinibacter roseus]TDB64375.1 XRE family transcriptional regulator [Arundinibacter roseus]